MQPAVQRIACFNWSDPTRSTIAASRSGIGSSFTWTRGSLRLELASAVSTEETYADTGRACPGTGCSPPYNGLPVSTGPTRLALRSQHPGAASDHLLLGTRGSLRLEPAGAVRTRRELFPGGIRPAVRVRNRSACRTVAGRYAGFVARCGRGTPLQSAHARDHR